MLKLPIKSSSQEIIITHKKHKVQSVSQPSLDLTRYLSNYLITYTVPNIVTFTRYLAFWATGTTFLQRKRLLWPELLTTSTCLSIPNLFIADHSCQDNPVQEGVICNNVPHHIQRWFVIILVDSQHIYWYKCELLVLQFPTLLSIYVWINDAAKVYAWCACNY